MEKPKATTLRAGDAVRHKSGGRWVIASVSPDGQWICPIGWPETITAITDCSLVSAATDEQHLATLEAVVGSRNTEGSRYYWGFLNYLALHHPDVRHRYNSLASTVSQLQGQFNDAMMKLREFEHEIRLGTHLPKETPCP